MRRAEETSSVTERLAALGEFVRLRIMRLLESQELSVGEVAQVVQLPQSTVSRHLKVLADGGWVARRNEGTATLYRLVFDDLSPSCRALWRTVREQMSGGELAEDSRRLAAVLDERKTDSQTFFGRASGEWDAIRAELFGNRFTSLALLSLFRRNWTIADIGCGTGNASELIAPVVERVLAIDQSTEMLNAARRRLRGHDNIEFIESPAERVKGLDGTVDVCVCMLVLHHLDQPEGAMRQMHRLLRADRGGGLALVVDMLNHDRDAYRRTMGHRHLGFNREAIETMMKRAGFTEISYRELPSEPEAKGPGLFAAVGRIKQFERS